MAATPQAKVQLPNDAYTVGWISAISTEKVAAMAFLDEEHEQPDYVAWHDNNVYTLGRIGKHNVVIAMLPDGEYGTAAATGVARDLVHSFPRVRIGLMVGIGGGAPNPKHDIRLGDVVVSSPGGGYSGVIQYDFGKTVQNQSFQITHVLDQPPTLLRMAVSSLRSKYEYDGHKIKTQVEEALSRRRRLRKAFSPPDPATDRLFRSDHVHPLESTDCAKTCDGDEVLISRQPRDEDEDDPVIHYGLVASANQLMKDAVSRDKLAEEKGVLCFEMEAAGLMNHFPCLVIRGICDYSDTHKNKDWQGYAAMTATAYAKDLLSQINPTRLEAEMKMGDLLTKIERSVVENNRIVVETGHNIKQMALQDQRKSLRKWLKPPDPSANLNRAMKLRHPGSGEWFLHSQEYHAWRSDPKALLWLNGKPGCGKSVLSSTIIHEHRASSESAASAASTAASKGEETLLYYFFDFNDKAQCSVDGLVRSLVYQTYCEIPDAQAILWSLYESCRGDESCRGGKSQPTFDALCDVLKGMLKAHRHVHVFIDALDECQDRGSHQTHGLFSWIQDFYDSCEDVHLLMTSRPEQDIQSFIHGWAGNRVSLPLQNDRVSPDIVHYIRTRVREHSGLARWRQRPAIQSEIESVLIEKADGMFRWVSCQLDALEKCLDPRALRAALNSLPRDLYETYARIIRAIPAQHWPQAKLLLQFLVYSHSPPTLHAAVDALAVDLNGRPRFLEENRMPVPEEITRYCSSLVTLTKGVSTMAVSLLPDDGPLEGELRLSHFSVKEWLTSDRLDTALATEFSEMTAHGCIAKVCLGYLLELGPCLQEYEHDGSIFPCDGDDIIMRRPFGPHATQTWARHAQAVDGRVESIGEMALEFLFNNNKMHERVNQLWNYPDYYEDRWAEEGNKMSYALLYASLRGLTSLVEQLLVRDDADVNAMGMGWTSPRSALLLASSAGHETTVDLLLRHGADVNFWIAEEHWSCSDCDGQVEDHDGVDYLRAIHFAAREGHDRTVRVLCQHGADPNDALDDEKTPLKYALRCESSSTVLALVENGARLGGDLFADAWGGCSERVARAFLEAGTDVRDNGYGSAIYHAASRGNGEIVLMLLTRGGAKVDEVGDQEHGTALQAAAAAGHIETVRMLVDHGADVNMQSDPALGNALYAALYYGLAVPEKSKTRRYLAAAGRHGIAHPHEDHHRRDISEELVLLLLERGADVGAPGAEYPTALHAALSLGTPRMVCMMIDKVNSSMPGSDSKSAPPCTGFAITEDMLACAAANLFFGSSMVALLLDRCASSFDTTLSTTTNGSRDSTPAVTALDGETGAHLENSRRAGTVPILGDAVIKAAAHNWTQGKAIITLLSERQGRPVSITEDVFLAALQLDTPWEWYYYHNRQREMSRDRQICGRQGVVTLLLEKCDDDNQVTSAVVEAAMSAGWLRDETLWDLVSRTPKGLLHVGRDLALELCNNRVQTEVVFSILLDKADGVSSVQSLLWVAATPGKPRMSTDLLQSLRERIPMIEDIHVTVTEDPLDGPDRITVILKEEEEEGQWKGGKWKQVMERVMEPAAWQDETLELELLQELADFNAKIRNGPNLK